MVTRGHPWVLSKKFSTFGPTVWPAIGNINTNVFFYYIDMTIIKPINFFQRPHKLLNFIISEIEWVQNSVQQTPNIL